MALYSIRCERGEEDDFSTALQEQLRAKDSSAIACFPKKIMLEKHNKEQVAVLKPLVPGLVLVSSDEDDILCDYPVTFLDGDDKDFPMWVLSNRGVIRTSQVEFVTGAPLKILSGPMKIMPGHIVRVTRREHKAFVEFPFMDDVLTLTLAIDFDYVYNPEAKSVS